MIQTCKVHSNGPGAPRALPSGAPYALPLTLGQAMCSSTDTPNASADGELLSDEESYDDEHEHDCRAQHCDDDDSEHDGSSGRSQSCGDHETDHDDMYYDPVDPDNIPIPFDLQYKNTCDGCIHDDKRKVCRSCESPDLYQFGLCGDCVAQADISEQCMLCTNLRLGYVGDSSDARALQWHDDPEAPSAGYSLMCWDCLSHRCLMHNTQYLRICPRCTGTSGLCKGCMPLLHGDNGALTPNQCCEGTLHTMHPLPPSTPCGLIEVNIGSSLCNGCQVGALAQYCLCWACGQEPPVLGGVHF